MRKIVSLILVIVMVSSMGSSVLANEGNANKIEIENALKSSLTEEFSDNKINEFKEWVDLYDSKGTRYAYLVTLYDNNNKIEGFSIISDINNKVLMTSTGENFANLLIAINNAIESQADSELIYEFPNAFYLKSGGEINQIGLDGLSKVDAIPENNLDVVSYLTTEAQIASTKTTYGSLKKWDRFQFVPVQVDGTHSYYYGGYQGWLTDEDVSSFWANRSCGVTAAANMMQYMSENVSGKSKLYTRSSMYKSQFSKYQKDVYKYLSPAIWGIPNLSTMISRVKAFASAQGVSLSEYTSSAEWNEKNVRKYVSGGLNSEYPVLLLTWNSPIPDLKMHWVTVTRLYGSPGSLTMVTSNWGGKSEYDFTLWVNGSSIYKGVIYFK